VSAGVGRYRAADELLVGEGAVHVGGFEQRISFALGDTPTYSDDPFTLDVRNGAPPLASEWSW
jgi:hypothetical protein